MDLSNWTPEQILQALGIIFTFLGTALLTIGGWVVVAKLNKANTDKAKAEAAQIYQDMANQAAERERKLLLQIEELHTEVQTMKDTIAEKDKENTKLRTEVANLRVQTDVQAQEILNLREEVQTLRLKRKS